METGRVVFIVCVVAFTAIAAVCDLRTKRLPNVLTVVALTCALLFHGIFGLVDGGFAQATWQLLFALAGFATGFSILFVLWLMGSGGGGDVKFMGALGAWLGAAATLKVFLVSAGLIVVGAIGVLVWEFCRLGMGRTKTRYLDREPLRSATNPEKAARQAQRRRLLPFGLPAALATWLVLAMSSGIFH